MRDKLSKLSVALRDWVTSDTSAQAGAPPQGTFVQGVNFGGEAVTIEGYRWDAYANALSRGLSVPGASVGTTYILPQPYASPNLRQMFNSVIYKSETLDIRQTLPNGSYEVYVWIMENHQTYWHSLTVQLNGQTVATAVGRLERGQWARYGGYQTIVTDGVLHLSLSTQNPNIDAHIMGMSIFRLG